jgi:Tfp pilus assembly major pilin PilA
MNRNVLWTLATIAALALAGCHKAEPPATVQRDLAQARGTAADQEAKAYEKAADTVNSTNQNMAMETQKADEKAANAAYDVAIAKADGDHKIASAKCESLSGNAQKTCLDQADAARDMAKAKAEAAKADHTLR